MSTVGLPAGATASFSVNNQVPPFTTTLTIGNLTGVMPDSYAFDIDGTSASFDRSITVGLSVSDSVPGVPTLTSPLNGALDVDRWPTLTWQAVTGAVTYEVEVATDAAFSNVIFSAAVAGTSVDVDTQLERLVEHFWHARASNGCGDGMFAAAYSFTTIDQADYFTEDFGSGGSFDLEGHHTDVYAEWLG